MKKQILQKLFVSVIGCLFLTSCLLPTSSTTVRGRVTEYGDKPVADAEISFGGTGFEATTKTDADGRFTVTARHRPTQILRLSVNAEGFVMREKVEFLGLAAPAEPVAIELMRTIPRKR
jgi:hypothetical protein